MCLVCTAVLLALSLDIFTPCTELFLLHVPPFSCEPQAIHIFFFIVSEQIFLPTTAPSMIAGKLDLWLLCHSTNHTCSDVQFWPVLCKWHGTGDKPAQGCLLCLARWGWVAGIWCGQVSASHRERAWALKSELLMDFASCVGSQSMTRPIAESEDGKAVSISSLITYMSKQQLTSPLLTPNPTHPQWGGRRSESEEQNQEKWIKIKAI